MCAPARGARARPLRHPVAARYTVKDINKGGPMKGSVSIWQVPRNRWRRVELLTNALIAKLSVCGHPGLQVKLSLEGYKDHCFGAKSGPTAGFDALAHELGHAVDFGPDAFEARCSPYGRFVFHVPEVEVLGRMYPDAVTGQASECEIRAFAAQWRLCEAVGLRLNEARFLEHVRGSLSFMHDWIAYHNKPDEVAQYFHRALDRFTLPVVTDRLVGWLDKTHERLRHAA